MFTNRFLKHVASLMAVVGLFILAAGSTDNGGGESSSSSSTEDLNATVRFNGTQFIISNQDSFDWSKVKLEVNSKMFSSGYTYRTPLMKAGETYTVGAMQFANSDGERFNPFTHKALSLSISCETPQGRGFYYGGWE